MLNNLQGGKKAFLSLCCVCGARAYTRGCTCADNYLIKRSAGNPVVPSSVGTPGVRPTLCRDLAPRGHTRPAPRSGYRCASPQAMSTLRAVIKSTAQQSVSILSVLLIRSSQSRATSLMMSTLQVEDLGRTHLTQREKYAVSASALPAAEPPLRQAVWVATGSLGCGATTLPCSAQALAGKSPSTGPCSAGKAQRWRARGSGGAYFGTLILT